MTKLKPRGRITSKSEVTMQLMDYLKIEEKHEREIFRALSQMRESELKLLLQYVRLKNGDEPFKELVGEL